MSPQIKRGLVYEKAALCVSRQHFWTHNPFPVAPNTPGAVGRGGVNEHVTRIVAVVIRVSMYMYIYTLHDTVLMKQVSSGHSYAAIRTGLITPRLPGVPFGAPYRHLRINNMLNKVLFVCAEMFKRTSLAHSSILCHLWHTKKNRLIELRTFFFFPIRRGL